MIMFIVMFLSIVCVLGVVHWYLWRRLVRDVSAPRSGWRRTGTVLVFLLPALSIAAQAGGRSSLPFGLKQAVAWPGLLWFAVLIYLLLTLLVLDAVRPLVRRLLERRAAARAAATTGAGGTDAGPSGAPPAGGGAVRTAGGGAAEEAPAAVALDTAPGTEGEGPAAPGPADRTGATALGSVGAGGPRAAHGGGDDGPQDASRRLFLARAAAVTAGTVAAVTVSSGAYSVLAAGPTTRTVEVVLDKLPPAADGYRLTLISDIHLSPVIGRTVCQRIVDRANATHADAIAIAGDLVDGPVADLRGAAAPLGQLRAREGVFFATGNHEYYSGYQEWNAHLAGPLGIRVLRNEREELRHFDIVGVNDLAGEEFDDGPDLPAALAGRDPERAAIMIAHQPAMIDEARKHGVDLQLSGHTHGGQMWPGNFLAALANPTLVGLERYGASQLYVTRGAGAWGPPVRVGAEPDITVLVLRSPR